MNNPTIRLQTLLIPILSVVMGFLLGAIIMLAFGYNPIVGYHALFSTAFQGKKNMGEILVIASPLIFTALGFSIAKTAGLFNIGLSGQALCGWIASIWLALSIPEVPRSIALPLVLLVGAVAGALAATIPGILRAYFGTSEVIVTIMMNYILLYIGNYITHNVMNPAIIGHKGATKMIGSNATLRTAFLTEWTNGSRLNLGFFLAILFLVLFWFLMKKTTLGFDIRSVGLNPFASEYAGMSSKRTIIFSMVISGALAGLGGAVQGLGTFGNFFVQSTSLNIGFDGMAVSLLGAGSSIGILLAALLFGTLKLGGQGMPLKSGVPLELVDVVIASIIFFIGISYVLRFLLDKKSNNSLRKSAELTIDEQSTKQEGGTI